MSAVPSSHQADLQARFGLGLAQHRRHRFAAATIGYADNSDAGPRHEQLTG